MEEPPPHHHSKMIDDEDDLYFANQPGCPVYPRNAAAPTTTIIATPPSRSHSKRHGCSPPPPQQQPPAPHHFSKVVDDHDDFHYANQPGAPTHYHPNYPYPPSPAPGNVAASPAPGNVAAFTTFTTPPPPSHQTSKRHSPTPLPPQQPPAAPPHYLPKMADDQDDVHYANQPGPPSYYHPNYPCPPYPAPDTIEAPATAIIATPPPRQPSKRYRPSPPPRLQPPTPPPQQQPSPPHHLPMMANDEGDVHFANQSGAPAHYHPNYPYPPSPAPNNAAAPTTFATPPPPSRHSSKRHNPSPPPPQQQSPPLTPPKPHHTPPSPPPLKLTPTPPAPPQKIPPSSQPYYDTDYNHEHDRNPKRRRISAVVIAFLILLGLIAIILWLIYRPHKPKFSTTSMAIFSFNITPPSYVTTTMQVTVLARNTNKHTSLYYDPLTATMHYNHHPITPPVNLPPLHHRKRGVVMISPLLGGAPVLVPPELTNGIVADQAYGVVGLSWVLTGQVRYRVGWFKSTAHSRIYVRCDVIVGMKSGGGGKCVYVNPTGEVPLLGNPPCVVDIN